MQNKPLETATPTVVGQEPQSSAVQPAFSAVQQIASIPVVQQNPNPNVFQDIAPAVAPPVFQNPSDELNESNNEVLTTGSLLPKPDAPKQEPEEEPAEQWKEPLRVRIRKQLVGTVKMLLLLFIAFGIGVIGVTFVSNSDKKGNQPSTTVQVIDKSIPNTAGGNGQAPDQKITINYPTTVSQGLTVNGLTKLQSLQINGPVSIQGTFNVNGTGTFAGNLSAANFSGNGSGLTNVDAVSLGGRPADYYTQLNNLTGLLDISHISPEVAVVNNNNAFTATNTFSGASSFSGTTNFSGTNTFTGSTSMASLLLAQPLGVSSGGTGVANVPVGGILYGQGNDSLGIATAAGAGLCLTSTISGVAWGSCLSAAGIGVASLDGLTDVVTISNTTANSLTGVITVNDATTAAKGIASFNATNFTVTSGAVNTIQNIATNSSPTFNGITLTTALSVTNGGTGATTAAGARTNLGAAASGANSDITSISGLTTALSVGQGGSGATTAAGARTNFGAAASGVNADITSLTGLTSITPGAALTIGATGQSLILQGGATTKLTATSGGSTNQLAFATPTSNHTITLPDAAGTVAVSASGNIALDSLGNITFTGTLGVLNGGTGSTTAGGARTNLGAAASGANSDITSLSGLTTALSVLQGGTGSTTAAGARTNLSAAASGANSDITSLSGLTTALSVGQGGSGATTAAGARTNLGAAASGANSDITSLSGLTTALSVLQGGTGTDTLGANGVLVGNGTSAITSIVAGSNGLCLESSVSGPVWQTCTGAGGVSSLDTLTGALTVQGTAHEVIVTDGSSTITLSTPQDIDVTSSPSFAGLTLSTALSVTNGGTGATTAAGALTNLGAAASGANSDITSLSGLTTALSVGQGGTGSTTAGGARTNLGAAKSGANLDLTSLNALTSIDNSAAGLSIGDTGQTLTLQGSGTTLTNTSGGFTTTVGFVAPTANVTYQFQAAAGGTYDICTTAGNCTGIGGGVTTAGGTTGTLALFSGSTAIGDSIVSQSGTTLTVGGTLAVNTITPTAALALGATTQGVTLQGTTVAITSTSAGKTNTLSFATPSGSNHTVTVPNASGTVAVSASGPLSIDAAGNISCASCVTRGGGGGGVGAVDSLDTMTGALTLQGTTNQVNVTDGSGTITFSLPQDINTSSNPTFAALTATNGLTVTNGITTDSIDASGGATAATFNALTLTSNATGFSVAGGTTSKTLTVTADATIDQDVSTTASPTFAALSLGTALSVGNGGTGSGTAGGARTNLGAAAAGANGDITSLTGLTTALSVPQGGTGAGTFTSNGLIYGNGAGTLQVTTAGTSGQILQANGLGVPGFVSLSGDVTVAAGGSVTIATGAVTSGKILDGTIADVDLNAGTFTHITGVGALVAGSIASGFGTISTGNTITTSTALQGATVNATTGFQVGGAASTGNFLRGNGTNFVSSAILSGDIPSGSGFYIQNGTAQQTGNFNIISDATGDVAATIQAASGSTADILDIVSQSGGIAATFDNNGFFRASSGATVQSGSSSNPALIAQGAASQTADIFQVKNNGGSVLASIDADGNLTDNATGASFFAGSLGAQNLVGGGNASLANTPLTVYQLNSGNAEVIRETAVSPGDLLQFQTSAAGVLGGVNSSGQLYYQSGSFTGTLAVGSLTKSVTYTLPADSNATDTICLQSLGNCAAGGGSFIVNGTSTQTGNFNIQSAASGSIAAIIQGAASQTADLLDFNSSAGTTLAKVDKNGNIFASFIQANSTASVTTDSVSKVVLTLQGLSGQTGDLLDINPDGSGVELSVTAAGDLQTFGRIFVGADNGAEVNITPNGASTVGALIRGVASQTADLLQLQVNGGSVKSGFDANGQLYLGATSNVANSRLYVTTFTASQALQVNQAASSQTGDLLQFQNSSAVVLSGVNASGQFYQLNSHTGTIAQASLGQNTTYTLPDPGSSSATICLSSGNCGGSGGSGYIINGTSTQTGNFNIQSATAGSVGAIIQGAASQTADLLDFKASADTNPRLDVDASGNINFGSGSGATDVSITRPSSGVLRVTGVVAGNDLVAGGNTALGALTLYTNSASSVGEVIRGASGQTADLIRVEATNNEILDKTDANGNNTTNGVNNTFGGLAVPVITSGSTTGTNFYYAVTATNAQGETTVSNVLAMNANTSVINWTQIPGATGYKIYRNTSNSFTSGSLLLTTIASGATVTYTDTGSATAAGLPPTAPTGTTLTLQGWNGQTGAALQVQNASGANNIILTTGGSVLANGGGSFGTISGLGSELSVKVSGSSLVGQIIRAAASQSADLFELQDSSSNVLANFDATGNLHIANAASAAVNVLSTRVSGDTNDRFTIGADGKLSFGSGSGVADTDLYRASANVLKTDSQLRVGGVAFTSTPVLGVGIATASNPGIIVKGFSGQTGDLTQNQDSNGVILGKVDANGNTYNYGTNTTLNNLAVPTNMTTSTGSSYYYVVTAYNAQGETVASSSVGMANNTSAITWNQITGATGYKLYRNTSNSFTSGSLLLTTITNGYTLTYTDTGSATSAGLPPTAPTGTTLTVQGWNGQTNNIFSVTNAAGSVLASVNTAGNLFANNALVVHGSVVSGAALSVIGYASSAPSAVIKANASGTGDFLQLQNSSGIVLSGINSSGQFYNQGGSFTGTIAQASLGQNTTYTLPDPGSSSATICLSSGNCAGTGGAGYIVNGTSTQTGNFNIQSAASGSVGAIIQAASGQTADLFEALDSSGNVVTKITKSGALNVSLPSATGGGFNAASFSNIQNSANAFFSFGSGANGTWASTISGGTLGSQGALQVQSNTTGGVTFGVQAATGQTGDLVQYQDRSGGVLSGVTASGGLYTNGTNNTFGNLAVPVISSGSTTGTNFYYAVTATNAQGETVISNVLAMNANTSVINWTRIPGANGYKIYRNTSNSFTSGSLLLTTITSGTTVTYTDTGSATSAGLPPTAPIGTGLTIQDWNGQTANPFQILNSAGATVVSINPGNYYLYGSGIANISSANNSSVQTNTTGTKIATAIAGNVALTLQNTATTPTGDLVDLKDTSGNILTDFDASGYLHVARAASGTDDVINVRVSGDSNDRFTIDANGQLRWGTGSGATDTGLSRSGSGILSTGGSFRVGGATAGTLGVNTSGSGALGLVVKASSGQSVDLVELQDSSANVLTSFDQNGYLHIAKAASSTDKVINVRVSGDSTDRFQVEADGVLYWGPGSGGNDTDLYRAAANVLKTSHSFVANNVTVGSAYNGAASLFVNTTASTVAETIQGAANQTADLLELQNSSSSVLTNIDATGAANFNYTAPSATDSSSNNVSTSLNGGGTGLSLVSSPWSGYSNAFSFDGVNRGANSGGISAGTSFKFTTNYTIEAKIKPGISSLTGIIAGRYSSSTISGGAQPTMYLASGHLNLTMRNSSGTFLDAIGATALTAGTTYDVSGTWDGTTLRVFVNGSLDGSVAASSIETADGTTRFLIGRDDDTTQTTDGGFPFNGVIDEVRVSNTARYTAGYTPASSPFSSDASTMALWHFDSLNGDANSRVTVGSLSGANGGTQVALSTNAATNTGLLIQGVSSQTADLLQLQNSSGTVVSSFGSTGNLGIVSGNISGVSLAVKSLGSDNAEFYNNSGTFVAKVTNNGNFDTAGVGSFGSNSGVSNTQLAVTSTLTTNVGVYVQAAASQTADLLQFQSSTPALLSGVNASGQFYEMNSGFAGTLAAGTLTAGRTYTLPDSTGTICLSSGNCSGSGGAGYIVNGTSAQTGNFNVVSAATGSIGAIIQGASGQTADILDVNTNASNAFKVVANGNATFANSVAINWSTGGINSAKLTVGSSSAPALVTVGNGTGDQYEAVSSNGNVETKIDANGNITSYGTNTTLSNLAVPVITSGSTTGTNFYYAVTATNAQGETVISNVLAMNANTSVINWTQINGATGYKIYRNTGNSFTSGTLLLTTITNGATVTYTDTGSATGGTFPPASVTGTKLTVQQWSGQTGDAFQVLSAGGTAVAGINTSGSIYAGNSSTFGARLNVLVSQSSSQVGEIIRSSAFATDLLELQDTSGNITSSFNNTGNTLTLGKVASSGTVTAGNLLFADGTTDGFAATLNTTTLTASRTLTIPDSSGTICLSSGNCSGSGGAGYIVNGTSTQTGNFNIASAAIGSVSALIQGASGQTADIFQVANNGASTKYLKVSSAGVTTINNLTVPAGSSASTFNIGNELTNQCSFVVCALKLTSDGGETVILDNGAADSNVNINGGGLVVSNTGASTSSLTAFGSTSQTVPSIVSHGGASQTGDLYQNQDVSNAVLSGFTANGALYTNGTNTNFNGLATPVITSPTTTGTTAYYVLTASNAAGETVASNVLALNTASATINWTQVPGATAYKLYRNSSNSFTSGSLLRTTITNAITVTFTDNGAATGAGLPPTAPTGTGLTLQGWSGQTADLLDLKNSGGSVIAHIDASGIIYTPFINTGGIGTGSQSFGGITWNGFSNPTGVTSLPTVVIQAVASQTADLQDWENSSGVALDKIDASGNLTVQNVTLAAGKSLKVTGDITANRPGSPTAGMLFYDTSTNQLIQYNGSKWVSAPRSATKIVAASNSSQTAKDAADYVATGSNDATTINTALSSLSAGGSVYLEEGTYTLGTTNISVPDNTTLAGSGAGTILKYANSVGSGTYAAITNSNTTTGTNVTIQNLSIDGNQAGQSGGTFRGIYFDHMGTGTGTSAVPGGKINGVIIKNVAVGSGAGIYLSNSSNNILSGNTVENSSVPAIFLDNSSNNNVVSGNTSQGDYVGINVNGSSAYNTISDNVTQGNVYYGINIFTGSNNVVSGNTVAQNSVYGIYLQSAAKNNISSNLISDNAGSGDNNGVYLTGSTNNQITANTITDSSCSSTCYAINISDTGSTGNYLSANYFLGDGTHTASIHDATTSGGNTYSNQQLTAYGDADFRNATDSTTAFQIQNAAGTSNLFVADTTNSRIGIGAASSSATLQVTGVASQSTPLVVFKDGSSQTGDLFEAQSSSGSVLDSIDKNGNVTVGGSLYAGLGLTVFNAGVINAGFGGNVALTVQGYTSQTADLEQNQDVNGAVLSGVNLNGGLYTSGTNNTFGNLAVPVITSPTTTGTTAYYVLTATNAAGETVASNVLGLNTSSATINWTKVPGATGYKLYRNTSNSFTSGSLLRTTITNGTTVTFIDNGAATSAGLPPTAATGTKLTIQGWSGQSGNLQEWQGFGGGVLARIDQFGDFFGAFVSASSAASIASGATSTVAVQVSGASGQTADLLQLQNSTSNVLAKFNANGDLQIGGTTASAASTTALHVETTGGNDVLTVDTNNTRVTVGAVGSCTGGAGALCVNRQATGNSATITNNNSTLTTNGTVHDDILQGSIVNVTNSSTGVNNTTDGQVITVADTSGSATGGTVNGSMITNTSNNTNTIVNGLIISDPTANTGNLLKLQSGATNVATISNTGAALFQNQANSSTAFQISGSGASGAALIVSTNNIASGYNAANATLDVAKDSGTGRSINAAGTINASGADYAEYYYQQTPGSLQPGQIACLVGDQVAAACGSDGVIIGAISANAGYVGNDIYDAAHPDNTAIVGMLGQLPIQVSVANGAIHAGDPIGLSGTTGVGAKQTTAGQIIGWAMADASADGTVNVLVRPQYYTPTSAQNMQGGTDGTYANLNVTGQTNLGDVNVSGAATVQTLTVIGDASIGGNLAVAGTLTVVGQANFGDIIVNGHFITAGNTPVAVALPALGENAAVSIDGNDTSGTITITTGDPGQPATQHTPAVPAPTAGEMASIAFANAFGKTPRIIITPGDGTSAPLQVFPDQRATDHFTFGITGTPAPHTTYTFEYFITQ